MRQGNSESPGPRSGSAATTSRRALVAVLVGASMASLLFGFVGGWVGSRRLGISNRGGQNRPRPSGGGDAPGDVRANVLQSLRDFQAGYSKRDPSQLGRFMSDLFPEDDDILICGTDPGEWIQGRESAQKFIGGDWAGWGDVRLAVDDAEISASGDVAWIATTGTVSNRPIRFTAVLRRTRDRWLFRQIQFQWDSGTVRLFDLLRPSVLAGISFQ